MFLDSKCCLVMQPPPPPLLLLLLLQVWLDSGEESRWWRMANLLLALFDCGDRTGVGAMDSSSGAVFVVNWSSSSSPSSFPPQPPSPPPPPPRSSVIPSATLLLHTLMHPLAGPKCSVAAVAEAEVQEADDRGECGGPMIIASIPNEKAEGLKELAAQLECKIAAAAAGGGEGMQKGDSGDDNGCCCRCSVKSIVDEKMLCPKVGAMVAVVDGGGLGALK